MPSFSQSQASYLAAGQFEGSSDYEVLNLEGSAKLLFDLAAEFAETTKENLNKKDRVASGALLDSIIPLPLKIMGKTIVAQVRVLDYYKHIDKGAKYGSKGPPIEAIKKWLLSEAGKHRNNKYQAISKRESRRQKITDVTESRAKFISKRIKEKGLPKTNFWTDAVKELKETINNRLGKQLMIDITNSLTDGNSNKP